MKNVFQCLFASCLVITFVTGSVSLVMAKDSPQRNVANASMYLAKKTKNPELLMKARGIELKVLANENQAKVTQVTLNLIRDSIDMSIKQATEVNPDRKLILNEVGNKLKSWMKSLSESSLSNTEKITPVCADISNTFSGSGSLKNEDIEFLQESVPEIIDLAKSMLSMTMITTTFMTKGGSAFNLPKDPKELEANFLNVRETLKKFPATEDGEDIFGDDTFLPMMELIFGIGWMSEKNNEPAKDFFAYAAKNFERASDKDSLVTFLGLIHALSFPWPDFSADILNRAQKAAESEVDSEDKKEKLEQLILFRGIC